MRFKISETRPISEEPLLDTLEEGEQDERIINEIIKVRYL